MADKKKVYWDSCVWLTLIKEEPGFENCQYIIEEAKKGNIQIWTSSLTLAEVYKFKAGAEWQELDEAKDQAFEDYILQDFVTEVQLDHEIAVKARRLCRLHNVLKKPTDGVHLASALVNNLDEFHTTDKGDLLRLDGAVLNDNGAQIKIQKPPASPTPPAPPSLPLFPDNPDAGSW